jgi:hypothetical protein
VPNVKKTGIEVRVVKTSKFAIAFWLLAVLCGPAAVGQEDVLHDYDCSNQPAPPVFEDDWIRVTHAEGWPLCHSVDRLIVIRSLPGALLKKDDFKLYLITHNDHASPVPRFVGLAAVVAPWTDLEEGRCGQYLESKITKTTRRLSRVDLYFDSAQASADALVACGNPEGKTVFWYGSYFVENCPTSHPDYDECGSFYIAYPRIAGKHSTGHRGTGLLSFALTFETKDPDYLPSRGDPDLNEVLKEATAIVRQIQYK